MRLLKRKRWFTAVLTALIIIGSMAGDTKVSAAEYDKNRTGSITVELNDIGTVKSEVGFRLYKVSELNAQEELAQADKSSAGEMRQLAENLQKKAEKMNIAYLEETTKTDGRAAFLDLAQELYLVCQSDKAQYGTVSPFLVEIPSVEGKDQWVYDVVANPKGEAPQREPDKPGEPSEPGDKEPPGSSEGAKQVKTGDESRSVLYFLSAAGALAVCLVIIKQKKQQNMKNS